MTVLQRTAQLENHTPQGSRGKSVAEVGPHTQTQEGGGNLLLHRTFCHHGKETRPAERNQALYPPDSHVEVLTAAPTLVSERDLI